MDWNNSDVMVEFAKIAEDTNLLGLKKTAAPAPNPYQEDKKTIEEKRLKTPEKSIMELAHPESVYVAESQGDGALVENEMETQKKMIEIINKMPTGSLVHRYAMAIDALIKMADACDASGESEAAQLLDFAATRLLDDVEKLPFDGALVD
jgi:hypothetical protein